MNIWNRILWLFTWVVDHAVRQRRINWMPYIGKLTLMETHIWRRNCLRNRLTNQRTCWFLPRFRRFAPVNWSVCQYVTVPQAVNFSTILFLSHNLLCPVVRDVQVLHLALFPLKTISPVLSFISPHYFSTVQFRVIHQKSPLADTNPLSVHRSGPFRVVKPECPTLAGDPWG